MENNTPPQSETPVTENPKLPVKIDFGKVLADTYEEKVKSFNPLTYAQSVSQIKKESPETEFSFTDESYEYLKEKFGEKAAIDSKKMFDQIIELSEAGDLHERFQSIRTRSVKNDLKNLDYEKRELALKDKTEKLYWKGLGATFQHTTFEESADKQDHYYSYDKDKNPVRIDLKEDEDFNAIASHLRDNMNSGLVPATNEFIAKVDPEIAKKIENKEIDPLDYHYGEDGNLVYRQLEKGEYNLGQARSAMGPRSLYNEGYLQMAKKGIQDGVVSVVESAAWMQYMGETYLKAPYQDLVKGNNQGEITRILSRATYNDFNNWTSSLKSSGSMEEDRGWSYSLSNATKQVFNGIGQILPTMGVGFVAGGTARSVGALSNLARMGKFSDKFVGIAAQVPTRILNFGVAAKAAKDESLRQGLSDQESDMMAIVAGLIMTATEFMTGSQFIPKMTGNQAYKEVVQKLSQHTIKELKEQGINVVEMIAKEPTKFSKMVYQAHKWLDSPASGMASGFAKGFAGEGIQEFTEDLGFSLVKEGYDYLTGSNSFDQEWDDVWHDLLGSFLMGGASGGMIKSVSSIGGKTYKNDQVDEDRNNIFVNMIAEGKYEDLKKAIKELQTTGFASKILSIRRDEKGGPIMLSNDKSLEPMSENDFFERLFTAQVEATKTAYDALKLNGMKSKQSVADVLGKVMDQTDRTQMDIGAVSKGVRMLMDIEGMQLFRHQTLLRGHLLLESAKAKAIGSNAESILDIEEIRLNGSKVLGIKRKGDAEFTLPSVEEETVLQMSYTEVFGKRVFDDKFLPKGKAVRTGDKLVGELLFKLERLKEINSDPVAIAEVETKLNEAVADRDKLHKELVDDVVKAGYSETMAETVTDLAATEEFKDEIFSDRRKERYVRNFMLNNQKMKKPIIFQGRENYNIEDYYYDRKRFEFFKEANKEVNEQVKVALEQTENFVSQLLATESDPAFNFQSAMGQIMKAFSDPAYRFSPELKKKVLDFFKKNSVSFSDAQIKAMDDMGRKYGGFVLKILDMVNADDFSNIEGYAKMGTLHDLLSAYKAGEDWNVLIERLGNLQGAEITKVQQALRTHMLPHFATDPTQLAIWTARIDSLETVLMQIMSDDNNIKIHEEFRANNIKVKEKQASKMLALPGDIYDFAINQNNAFSDNYREGESEIETKIKALEAIPDFIDSGEILQITKEIRKNQRFLVADEVGTRSETVTDFSNHKKAESKLDELETRLIKLNEVSQNNRGDRFRRDFQVSMDYVRESHEMLTAISKAIGLGIEEDLDQIDTAVDPKVENADAVHEQLEWIFKLEEKVSALVSKLDDTELSTLFEKLSFSDIHANEGLLTHLYKKANEDNENPFSPTSTRDINEMMLSYILFLSREGQNDFFTYGKDYMDKSMDLTQENSPSREQILVARQLFSKVNSKAYSNVENFLRSNYADLGFSPATVYLRGSAGTGKSSMVMNMVFDIASRANQGKSLFEILYSAPIQEQIDTLTKSLGKIKGKIQTAAFKLSDPNDPILEKIFSGKAITTNTIVIDEATIFSTELKKLIKAVEEHNEKHPNNVIRLVFSGDDFQQATGKHLHNYMYDRTMPYAFERTTPLTTPFRTGKIDSFDIQMSRRKLIGLLTQLLLAKMGKGRTFTVPGTGEVLPLENKDHQKVIYQKIADAFKFKKEARYFSANGIVKKGIKALSDKTEVMEEFLRDIASRPTINTGDMVLITKKGEEVATVSELQGMAARLGLSIGHVSLSDLVKSSHDVQGREFSSVYVNFVLPDTNDTSAHYTTLKSLYVSESREREVLVMISNGDITSKQVSVESDIIEYPPLDFTKTNPDNSMHAESAQLVENNLHIQSLFDILAKTKPVSVPEIVTPKTMSTTNPPASEAKNPPAESIPESGTVQTPEEKNSMAGSYQTGTDADIDASLARSTEEISKAAAASKAKGWNFGPLCN